MVYTISDSLSNRGDCTAPRWLPVFLVLACFFSAATSASAQTEAADAGGAQEQPAPDTQPNSNPLTRDQPLITQKEIDDFRREQAKYSAALRDGEPRGPSLPLIKRGIRAKVLGLSLPANRDSIAGDRNSLIREIRIHAGSKQTNERFKTQFRRIVLDEVIMHCKALLQNHQDVRIQAATLLGQLNLLEEDRLQDIQAMPYEGSLPPLMEAVASPDQPEAVKIAALHGVRRILSDPRVNLSKNVVLDTSEKLTAQLKPNQTFFWYQYALVQTLSLSNIDSDLSGEPFIVQALAEVVADGKRDPRVRCAAAQALGHVPIAPNVDVSVLSYQIASLTNEMVVAYRANPKQVFWIQCFFDLYAGFQPVNAVQRANKAGLVLVAQNGPFAAGKSAKFNANHPAVVADAFDHVAPVINHVLNKDRGAGNVPATITQPLVTWLKEKDPGQIVIYDGAKPITGAGPQVNPVTGR